MSPVSAEQNGPVLLVRFDNGPGNFITGAMVGQLLRIIVDAERNPSVRAVVLTGDVDGVFIGHYDIHELLAGFEQGGLAIPAALAGIPLRAVSALGRIPGVGGLLDRGPTGGLRALLRFQEVVRRMRTSDMVFVAAIDGFALGGGFELALACDVRIIGEGSYGIGLPEITFGLLPAGGGTQVLTRLIGYGGSIDALLESRLFTPAEARQEGVVQRQVKQEDVVSEALAVALRLSRWNVGTVKATKRAVYDGGSGRFGRGMAVERNGFLGLATRKPAQATVQEYAAVLIEHLNSGGEPTDFFRKRLPDWKDELPPQLQEDG